MVMASSLAFLALLGGVEAAVSFQTVATRVTSTVTPAVFQTTPEVFAGPTATGPEPFLAQTDPVFGGTASTYLPPSPLETAEPIKGAPANNGNIFHQMGNLSPYHPSPGFGVDEYPIPDGAEISWLNMIHRHGSRYPTDPISLGAAIAQAQSKGAKFSGDLDFLNTWKYTLGVDILSPWGRQECYDSGVAHVYQYGHLFNPKSTTKLVARTTTMDRMRKTAENFLAGFWGLGWNEYVNLEFIIDETGYNNSLAGYNACPNNNNDLSSAGANASDIWTEIYTKDAVKRLNGMSKGFTWNASTINDAQQICAYETISVGYSSFCDLFTFTEWEGFEQSIDLDFYGTYGFASPTGRAVGVAYVSEVLARIHHNLLTTPAGSANITYDKMAATFPIDQTLNLDFSHDVNIFAVLTAFGFTQFAPFFSDKEYDANRKIQISNMIPFAAVLDIEIIDSPKPVKADRTTTGSQFTTGSATKYIHFKLNQRTLPLGESFSKCGKRADGWCELTTFLKETADALAISNYDYACNGDYKPPVYGAVKNGTIGTPK